jgi:hypothetical protein
MKVLSQRQGNVAFQRYEIRVQQSDISGATNAAPPGAPLAARRALETGQERSARRRRAVEGRVLALHAVPRVGGWFDMRDHSWSTRVRSLSRRRGQAAVTCAKPRPGYVASARHLARRWHVRPLGPPMLIIKLRRTASASESESRWLRRSLDGPARPLEDRWESAV